jgi:hypothetical protein
MVTNLTIILRARSARLYKPEDGMSPVDLQHAGTDGSSCYMLLFKLRVGNTNSSLPRARLFIQCKLAR